MCRLAKLNGQDVTIVRFFKVAAPAKGGLSVAARHPVETHSFLTYVSALKKAAATRFARRPPGQLSAGRSGSTRWRSLMVGDR